MVRLGRGLQPAALAGVFRTLQALGPRVPWSGVAVIVPPTVGFLGVWHFVSPSRKLDASGRRWRGGPTLSQVVTRTLGMWVH